MTQTQTTHILPLLEHIVQTVRHETISIGTFIDGLHEKCFGILLFLFALPMALPLPVPPGINLLFATPLLFLTFQLMIGRDQPWLPEKARARTLKRDSLEKIIEKARPMLYRLTWFIHPRLAFMTGDRALHVIGLFGFLFALCICVPIPLTNTVPSFAIMVMAIGILMGDGLAVLIGMIIGSAWVTLLATLGVAGFKALVNTIF